MKDLVINEYRTQLSLLQQPEVKLRDVEKFKEKYYKAIENANAKQRISFGNGKLPHTTAISNMTSWFNCPGRTQGFCDICKICYDKFREVSSWKVCSSRLNNEIWFRENDEETIANAIIVEIKVHNLRNPDEPVKLHRWNEVGEMADQDDLCKVNKISNLIFEEIGVKSYIYTHNKDLDFDFNRPNLTILGSGFMVDNNFLCLPPEEYDEYVKTHQCFECVQDCESCGSICSWKLGITIVEKLRK